MTTTYTSTHIVVTNSTVLANYIANTSLVLTTKLSTNCGEEAIINVDYTGNNTTNSYLHRPSNTLYIKVTPETGIYGVTISYTQGAYTYTEKDCSFYDKDNEIKCKAYSTITTTTDYLYYEYLAAASQCNDCDCSTLCDALNILNNKLSITSNASSNQCSSC